MVLYKSNEQLIKEENEAVVSERAAEEAAAAPILNQSLIATLINKWDSAVRNKRMSGVEAQWFKNIDQVNRQYDSQKLAAIKEIGGSEAYPGITESKYRHAKAWIRDAIFQAGKKPFGVKPTPVPDLPKQLLQDITGQFISETLQNIQTQSGQAGIQVDMQMAVREIQNTLPELKNRIDVEIRSVAWEKGIEIEKEVDDKLVDGSWYEALDQCIPDAVQLGTGIMLGPFKRKKKMLVAGDQGPVVEEPVIDEFERISPFNVYPDADSSGPDDGGVHIKLQYRRTDLQKLIDVEGFNSLEIKAVLSEFSNAKLRDWTYIEVEKAIREKKTAESVYSSDTIDCLLYMGPLSGQNLREAGIDIPENRLDYDFLANVWYVGNHYIKAVLNEDPLGRQPISIAHFEENVDGWWGKGLPEMIECEQTICNACARAIVNNVGMGSGPQVEINVDRLRGGDKGDTRIIPWKRWLTNNKGMQTGNAINFWQPNMHAQEILFVFNDFRKGADDRSGIPAYAHGDPQVGGAGNTASGLSMLITQAARGIRGIIKNIDKLTIRTVTFVYENIALNPKYRDKIGDVKLMALGSQALIEKEQRAVRMLEFLNATNNPVDQSLMGPEGRGYLLSEVARTYEIDPERAITQLQALRGKQLGVPNTGTPAPATRPLDMAGNEVQGQSSQLITGRGGEPTAPATQQ